jgi:hypothetical protein
MTDHKAIMSRLYAAYNSQLSSAWRKRWRTLR